MQEYAQNHGRNITRNWNRRVSLLATLPVLLQPHTYLLPVHGLDHVQLVYDPDVLPLLYYTVDRGTYYLHWHVNCLSYH